eukprot:1159486-Pelagomonas_calceolata.AAC.4
MAIFKVEDTSMLLVAVLQMSIPLAVLLIPCSAAKVHPPCCAALHTVLHAQYFCPGAPKRP